MRLEAMLWRLLILILNEKILKKLFSMIKTSFFNGKRQVPPMFNPAFLTAGFSLFNGKRQALLFFKTKFLTAGSRPYNCSKRILLRQDSAFSTANGRPCLCLQ
jgi:hypothetical protein